MDKYISKTLYVLIFILLIFQVGFRWETGTDWVPYYNHFLAAESYEKIFVDVLLGFEIGYGFFVYFIRSFTNSYSIFLIIHALIYYFLILKASKLLSPFPILSIFIYYTSTMGILGSNRQLLSLAICLYSLRFILEKKNLLFFACVFFAFLFHTSALFFLIYYFLNRDFKRFTIVGALLFSIIIGKSNIPTFAFSNFANFLGGASSDKAEGYVLNQLSDTSLSLTGLIRRLIFFVLFIFNYDFLVNKWTPYRLIFNGYIVGLCIYFLFKETFIILVGRGSFYFNVMECFLLASQLLLFKYKKERSYILIFFLIYSCLIFYQSISEFPMLFLPYKGLFINEFYLRDGL